MKPVPVVQVVVTRNAALDRDTLLHVVALIQSGERVCDIAGAFELQPKTIYYWVKKLGVDLKQNREEVRKRQEMARQLKRDAIAAAAGYGVKGRNYYSYVQEAYKQGRINKRQRDTGLARFYRYRGERIYTHSTSVPLNNMSFSND